MVGPTREVGPTLDTAKGEDMDMDIEVLDKGPNNLEGEWFTKKGEPINEALFDADDEDDD